MKLVKQLRKLLSKYWDEQGGCHSCGWHGCLYEHCPEWSDWNKEKKCFELSCVNKDVDTYDHRGVFVYLDEKDILKFLK